MSSEDPATPFFDLLEAARGMALVDGRGLFEMPATWGQGRTCFGGALTAVALEAMSRLLAVRGEDRRIRSLQVVFVAPVAPGSIALTVAPLRHGRSATVVEVRVMQGDAVCMTAIASFASDRESVIAVAAEPRPSMIGPEGLRSLPYLPGITPSFVQHVDMRWVGGGPPGSGLTRSDVLGWCRLREPQVEAGPAWIAALVDAWPAPTLQMLRRVSVASSLSWDLQLLDLPATPVRDGWWAYAADTEAAGGGWVHTSARLWAPDGQLVALGRQTVAQFA